MPIGQVKVGFDGDDFINEAKKVADALLNQVNAVDQLAVSMAKYNSTGEIVRATVRGITQDGEKFETTFKVKNQAIETVNTSLKALTATYGNMAKAQRDAQNAAIATGRRQDASTAEGLINNPGGAGLLGSPARGLSVAQLNQYESAVQRIKDQLRSGAVDLQRFKELFAKVKADPRAAISGLSGADQTVVSNLRNIVTGFKEASTQGQAAGERIVLSWQSVVRIFESQVIRQGVRGIIAEFKNAVVNAAELDVKISQLKAISGDASISTAAWTQQLTKLANSYGIDQIQAADAAYTALQSQVVNSKNAMGFLDAAFKLTSATTGDVKDSVKLLSTTMNAFRIDAVNADQTANILFQTMTKGQVDASTFADGMGRLGSIANTSGVKLEEVSAALETLNQKGLKFNDAAKLIEDVLRSITKPTAEMKQLFAELGVSGAEALIKLEGGFGGVLKLLDSEAAKGNEHLGELVGSFQNMRAVAELSGDAFDKYNDNLREASANTQALNKASLTVRESIGKQFQAELARTRTYLTNTFGTEVAKEALALGKAIGGDAGLVGVLQKLVPLIKAAVVAFIAYKSTQLLSAAATTIATANEYRLAFGIAQTTGLVVAETRALIVRNAALTLGISLAAAYAAYQLTNNSDAGLSFSELGDKGYEEAGRALEESKKNNASRVAEEQKVEDEITAKSRQAYNERYAQILRYSAQVVSETESLKKRSVDNLKDIADAVRDSSNAYYSALQKNISDLKKSADDAKNEIKASLKLSEDLGKKGSDAAFREKLKYANPGTVNSNGDIAVADQQEILLKTRIRELQKSSVEEYKTGTRESVAEARKQFDEITNLQQQLSTNQETLKRKQFDADVAHGRIAPSDIDPLTGKARYDFVVKTADLEKTITGERKKQIQLEDEYRKKQLQKQKDAEKAAEAEKQRLAAIRQAITEAAKFSALDDKGKIKDEFKKDPELAARQYQELVDRVKKLGGADANNDEFKIFVDLQNQKKAIVTEVQTTIAATEAKSVQNRILNEQKVQEKFVQAALDTKKRVAEQFAELSKEAAGVLSGIDKKGLVQAVGLDVLHPRNLFSDDKNIAWTTEERDKIRKAAPAFTEAKNALSTAQGAERNFLSNQSVENANKLADALGRLREATQKYLEVRTGHAVGEIVLPGDQASKYGQATTASQRLDEIKKTEDALRKQTADAAKAQSDLDKRPEGLEKLKQSLDAIPEASRKVAEGANDAKVEVNKAFDGMNFKAGEYIQQLNIILEKERAIGSSIPERRGNRGSPEEIPVAPGNMYGTGYYGSGGLVGLEPRGSDQYAAMLARGEMVINSSQSAKFAPLLQAINSGSLRAPSYSEQSQITNVGDIHINYQGSGSVGVDVRELGKQLRREILRGNISLSK